MVRTKLARLLGACVIGAFCVSAGLGASDESPVAAAAQRGDKDAVLLLLKQAADVNAAQGDGMTALHWAAMHGDADMTSVLLYAGANVKATTRIGNYTPLLLAAREGSAAVIDTLVKSGADVNAKTLNGTTALMYAAASGSVDTVNALIAHGADVNSVDGVRGLTAAMYAAAADRAAVLDALAGHGADLKKTSKVVDLAALSKDPATLQGIIFGNPAPPPKEGEKPNVDQRLPGANNKPGQDEFEESKEGAQKEGPANESAAKEGAPAKPAAAPNAAAPVKATAAKESEASAQEQGPAKEGTTAKETAPAKEGSAARENAPAAGRARPAKKAQLAGIDRQFLLNELVSAQGGLTPLHFAARDGHLDSVKALIKSGADLNQVTAGDKTSPLLIATLNGQFDVAKYLLDNGADPRLASDNGVTPLYAAINCEWAPKALYPQPRAYLQQKTTYLDLMKALLDKGADPNVRLKKKVWYSGYSFDLSGVDEIGATPFWRAAYASDVDAMKLLVAHGADSTIPTMKPAGRPRAGDIDRQVKDVSGIPPVPIGGPGIPPLLAAAGAGYGEGFAANAHRFAPGGMMAAVKYLVDDLHADVNAKDHEGNTALHNAASRGDNEMIEFLVSRGADATVVNREGKTTADMANGPVQRIQPFPETIALLEKLGSKNNHKCVSCN